MKFKGDLDSIGLAELFKTLADQNASGILVVSSSMGEKRIALTPGEVAISSDRLSERVHLGDLLVMRGNLTEVQLSESLKSQRSSRLRSKLGDVLVKDGLIKAEDITEALRFQCEEELYDLFTWKNATFEFDGDKTLDDVYANDVTDKNVHRMAISTQALILEATHKTVEWKVIEGRLKTPYICFKLSAKGEELIGKATPVTQRILQLLKEGRTVETTIKRSSLGRFNVCKTIIKLLDDGWLAPYPASDLHYLASEHRFHKRFTDALYIYRRLFDATNAKSEQDEIQGFINDTVQAIHRAKESGEAFEGSEVISYKAAAAKYKQRQKQRQLVLGIFAVVSFIITALFVAQSFAPKTQLPEEYTTAIKAAEAAVEAKNFQEAIRVWNEFYNTIPDKNCDLARSVTYRLKNLPDKLKDHIEGILQSAELLEKNQKTEEAETVYKKLLEQYPDSPLASRVKTGLERIEKGRELKHSEELTGIMGRKLQAARSFLQSKHYTSAKNGFLRLQEEYPDEPATRKEVDEALKQLKDIEERSQKSMALAEAQLRDQNGEKAIASFDAVYADWPDLPWTETARKQSQNLKARMAQLKRELERAGIAETRGNVDETLQILRQISRDYEEFELIAGVKSRITLLSASVGNVDKQLKDAQSAFDIGDKVRARQIFGELMKYHPTFLSSRNVKIPVHINSNPEGAALRIDGIEVGLTPQVSMLPVDKPITLNFNLLGYGPEEKKLPRLMPNELEIMSVLTRKPLKDMVFDAGIFAPPKVINGVLFVLYGTSLAALEPSGKQIWDLSNLLDDNSGVRPNSNGTGVEDVVNDHTWWYTRSAPESLGVDKVVLLLRSCVVLEIDIKTSKHRKLISLPTEPVGQAYTDPIGLAGKPLIIVGCADGKIRAYNYNLGKPSDLLWERAVDPDIPAPKGTLATGLSSRPGGSVIALSANGRLSCFVAATGQILWTHALNATMAGGNTLPSSSQENLAVLVHLNGAVTAVDLKHHEKVWELPASPAMDENFSSVTSAEGVFFITSQGRISKFSRDGKFKWQKTLEGPSDISMVLGKSLFAVSNFGKVYAKSLEDGHDLWTYRTEKVPSHLSLFGNNLYLATQVGRMFILNTE